MAQDPKECEHTFLTAEPHAHVRFRRVIERRALWLAEDAARELPNLPLEDLLQLVYLYAERGSPKYERTALRWLERYLTEGSPRLQHVAEVVASLARRDRGDGGKLACRAAGGRSRADPGKTDA